MIKHYVEYFYPGLICSETSEVETKDRYPSSLNVPDNAFGFRFFDKEEIVLESGNVLKSDRQNYSPNYYYGEKYTLNQVKLYYPESKTLIANMEWNHWDAVVRTKFGQFIPLTNNDIVL